MIASADILKSDATTISFLSPDEYEGINIKSDKTSKPDIISFEYLGIPAEIPKSIFSEFSLIFTLFSDEVPNIIESLPKDSFRTDGDMGEVFFLKDNISLRIVYYLDSGIPKSFEAGNDEISISLIPKNIKYT